MLNKGKCFSARIVAMGTPQIPTLCDVTCLLIAHTIKLINSEAVTSVSGSREHLYARVHFLAQLRVVFPFVEDTKFQFL